MVGRPVAPPPAQAGRPPPQQRGIATPLALATPVPFVAWALRAMGRPGAGFLGQDRPLEAR